jgi:hypothetical protein
MPFIIHCEPIFLLAFNFNFLKSFYIDVENKYTHIKMWSWMG